MDYIYWVTDFKCFQLGGTTGKTTGLVRCLLDGMGIIILVILFQLGNVTGKTTGLIYWLLGGMGNNYTCNLSTKTRFKNQN